MGVPGSGDGAVPWALACSSVLVLLLCCCVLLLLHLQAVPVVFQLLVLLFTQPSHSPVLQVQQQGLHGLELRCMGAVQMVAPFVVQQPAALPAWWCISFAFLAQTMGVDCHGMLARVMAHEGVVVSTALAIMLQSAWQAQGLVPEYVVMLAACEATSKTYAVL